MSPSSKMSLSVSALPFVPQEILLQILSKLPAKSLVRFKCVSKFFSSLADDHSFAYLHRNFSLTLPSRMSILIFYPPGINTTEFYTINYSEENQAKLQANRLRYLDDLSQNDYLRSAVNGLLCLCRFLECGDDIEIHNLSTRRHISLPTTCPDLWCDFRSRMDTCGLLGFDSISKRYKVLKSVKFTQFTDHGRRRRVWLKHWVFTLGVDKSWREIHSSPSFHPYNYFETHFYFCTSVHIDGIIYSLNSLSRRFEIVTFDVRTENFKAMPPPPAQNAVSPRLIEMDGRLAVLYPDLERQGFSIWTLEESMVWKKQYCIHFPTALLEEEIARQQFYNENLFFASNCVVLRGRLLY